MTTKSEPNYEGLFWLAGAAAAVGVAVVVLKDTKSGGASAVKGLWEDITGQSSQIQQQQAAQAHHAALLARRRAQNAQPAPTSSRRSSRQAVAADDPRVVSPSCDWSSCPSYDDTTAADEWASPDDGTEWAAPDYWGAT